MQSTNRPVSSFETDRHLFFGNNGYGTWQSPHALYLEELSCSEALRDDNIGALLQRIEHISPNTTTEVIQQLGQVKDLEEARKLRHTYATADAVKSEIEKLNQFGNAYLANYQAETPNT